MKKITYEEVNKSIKRLINIVQIVDEGDLGELGFEYSNEEFKNDLSDTRYFIEQHKPPTFDEVIGYWESIGYGVSVNYDNKIRITSVMQKGNGKLKQISFDWLTDFIDWGQYVHSFSKDEWYAINLTISYLESIGFN